MRSINKPRTCGLSFGDESTSMVQRIGGRLRRGFRMRQDPFQKPGFVVLLPSEHRAEQGERFASAGGRLEQRVAVAVSLGAIERGYDAAHEGELGPVGLVREFDLEASDLVDVFRGFGI